MSDQKVECWGWGQVLFRGAGESDGTMLAFAGWNKGEADGTVATFVGWSEKAGRQGNWLELREMAGEH